MRDETNGDGGGEYVLEGKTRGLGSTFVGVRRRSFGGERNVLEFSSIIPNPDVVRSTKVVCDTDQSKLVLILFWLFDDGDNCVIDGARFRFGVNLGRGIDAVGCCSVRSLSGRGGDRLKRGDIFGPP